VGVREKRVLVAGRAYEGRTKGKGKRKGGMKVTHWEPTDV